MPSTASTIKVTVQYAMPKQDLPLPAELRRWVRATLAGRRESAELTVRIVDEAEGAQLNESYRRRPGPTNVLSFPFVAPMELPRQDYLGDLVICAPLVAREAREQHKDPRAHWAHLLVHGGLHLLGYDHGEDGAASVMESLETAILARLGYPDPYQEISHT